MNRTKALLTTGVIGVLLCPGPAVAADPFGTYVVSACSARGAPAPLAGWTPDGGGQASGVVNTCAKGGVFGVEFPASQSVGSRPRAGWSWKAPPDVGVQALRLWRTAVFGQTVDEQSDYAFTASGVGFPTNTVDSDFFAEWSDFQTMSWSDAQPTALAFSVSCVCLRSGAFVRFTRIEMVLRDRHPPKLEGPFAGTLAAPGPLSGPVSLQAAFSDRGGGLKSAALLVDGIPRVDYAAGESSCREPYTAPAPCPRTGRADLPIDTTTLSNGEHRFALMLSDVAGNRTLAGPLVAQVHNDPPGAEPLSRPGHVVLKHATLRARYGSRVRVRGTLMDAAHSAIAGATVEVATRLDVPRAEFATGSATLTGSAGQFSVLVERGPSRVVRLRYGDSEAFARVIIPAPLRLAVRPRVTRNGKVVRLTGGIPDTAAPVRLELQAWTPPRWAPFRTVALKNGRFSARYRFTETSRTARYRFRAVVRRTRNLPYAAGHSNIVRVTVRP